MSDTLTRAVVRLIEEERFYAELVLQMNRIISKTKVPTAGVNIKEQINLYVNPDFFDALSPQEQVAVLIHECKHILHDHIPRSKELAPEIYAETKDVIDGLINKQKHMVLNVAADCSINPGIRNVIKEGCFPKQFDLPDGETFEWYVEHLKNNEKLKDLNEYDEHSLWAESEGDKEELKAKIRQAVNKAASNAKAAGSMSHDAQMLVDRLNYNPRDWKGDLKRFAARAIETKIESSKKKRNRRYGIMYPGSVKEELLHIGVAIDTSGSMSDEAINQCMAEIGNIAKYAKVTVVEADAEVKNSYTFDPKKVYTVSGRGGTAYQPAFDYFTDNTDVDGVVYLGDMDASDSPTKPKYPVLWAIFGNQEPPADFGSKTRIEIQHKGNKK